MSAPNPLDLVRLDDCRATPNPDSDPALQRLITAVSRAILTTINRPAILPRLFTETQDIGRHGILLRNWPVTSVRSVVCGSVSSLAGLTGLAGSGWTLDPPDEAPPGRPQMLRLGCLGAPGAPRATITYTAGYQVTEPSVIPQGGAYTALQPYGAWGSDVGVTFADGTPLIRASSAPTAGQYVPDGLGGYSFAPADAGRAILVTYGYVPADLANAARDWILDRQAYGDRIGLQSKSLGGQETISYRITATPDFVRAVLQQYTNVVPPC